MAEKDFTATENQDRGKPAERPERTTPAPAQPLGKEAENKTDVKNAHATGDGSFGRSESSLPVDDEEPDIPVNNSY